MPQASERINPPNAIAYALYICAGGRRAVIIAMSATLIVVGLLFFSIFMSINSANKNTNDTWQPCVAICATGEIMLLGLLGPSVVSSAIRRDLQSGMIESHRLTPDHSISAALGYVFGSQIICAGPIIVAAIGWLIGIRLLGFSVSAWLWWQIFIVVGAALFWSSTALLTFIMNSAAVWVLIVIIGMAVARVCIYAPAILALAGPPFTGNRMMLSNEQIVLGGISICSALAVIATLIVAIARMYRSNGADAFGVMQSAVFFGVWVLLTVVGELQRESLDPGRWIADMTPLSMSLVGWISCLLISVLAVAAAARVASRPPDTYSPADRPKAPAARWLLLPLYAVAAWLPFEVWRHTVSDITASTSYAMLCMTMIFVIAAGMVFAASTLVRSSGWVMIMGWLVISTAVPLLIAVGYDVAQDRVNRESGTYYFIEASSPFGAVGVITNAPTQPLWGPVAVQALLALGPVALYANLVRKRKPARVLAKIG